MFRLSVSIGLIFLLSPNLSPGKSIAVKGTNDEGKSFYTVYYNDESFLKRGICNPEIVPDPSLCTEKIPEESKKVLPLLEHTTGVYLKHFKELFAKVSPRLSVLTTKMVEVLEGQNIKIKDILKSGEDLSELHEGLLKRQLKQNDEELKRLKVQSKDADNWLQLLKSPVVFRYECDGKKGNGDCDEFDQKLRPFVTVTEQVFRLVEYEEYALHNWTCVATCEVTTDFRWNTKNTYFSPLGGGFGGHDVGDGRSTTHNSFPWATGQKTREDAEKMARAQCTAQSSSTTTNYERKDYYNQRASSTTTVTANVKEVSCNVKKPDPAYSPRPFPY